MSTQTATETTTWKIDPSHTTLEFSTKHMMITTVKGRFTEVEGKIALAEGEAPDVEVSIPAASIDTGTGQRDDHLRSGDFLDVENHPALTFRATAVDGSFETPGDTFSLRGELTIRGTTKPVTLEVRYEGEGQDPWGGTRRSFSATGKIDRRDWGLTWNQALETGGVLVSNEIRLNFEIQAVLDEG